MKTHDLKNFDQAQCNVLRDQLLLHRGLLRGLAHTAGVQLSTPPQLTGDIFADIRALEMACSELESAIGASAPTFSPAARSSVNSPSPLAKKAMSMTAQILAARGCESIEELNVKFSGGELATAQVRRDGDDEEADSKREQEADKARVKKGDDKKSESGEDEFEQSERRYAAAQPVKIISPMKQNLTRAILKAKGCNSIAELNKKHASRVVDSQNGD